MLKIFSKDPTIINIDPEKYLFQIHQQRFVCKF